VMAIVGGAKVSTKIQVLTNLAEKVDMLVVGGAMANTFLHALGHSVGKSLCEPDQAEAVREIMRHAKKHGCEIVLPVDVVVAGKLEANAPSEPVGIDAVPDDALILDIGPKSVAALEAKLANCKTLLWNGPLGAFETPPFGAGTFAFARAAAAASKAGRLVSVAGGGDTVAALRAAGAKSDFTYVSTAGGAFLEWLSGNELPAVTVLAGKQNLRQAGDHASDRSEAALS
jgi:phosphoglycerate kinase